MLYRILPRKFDRQVAVICALIMACTIPFYVTHEAQKELDFIFDVAKREIKVIAENVAVNSVNHIVTRDYSSLEDLLIRSSRFPNVVDVVVSDDKGKIISDVVVTEGKSAEPRYSVDSVSIPDNIETQVVENMKNDQFIVWSPIKSGTHLGWVKINYNLAGARKHKNERLKDYFIDGAILILILSLFLMLSMRKPLRLIETVIKFTARLDEKAGSQLPVIQHSVEFESLFEVLNRASVNLFEQDEKIKKGVKDLETQKRALDEHSIVTITDMNGNITYANKKLLNKTGFKIEELIGKNPRIFSSGYHSKIFYKHMWQTIAAGKTWKGEIVDKDKHGNKLWMQTTIVPFLDDDGVPYEYVAIQSDITAQKESESLLEVKNSALEIATSKLEHKVKERTKELEKANSELQELNNVKSEFVSIVSHELRTPLTAIKSFAEILEDDFENLDPDTRGHYLSIINEESVRLGRLINDVLDLQKMDAGKTTWNYEKTDIKKLVSSTIELFSKSYSDKGLILRLDLPDDELITTIDSDKIKQVLSNLLSNAYKFTEKGSVTLELKKTIKDPVVVIVDDDDTCLTYLNILLQGLGFQVIPCLRAKDALELVRNKSQQVDLLITDIMMPEMSGVELIETIRGINKKLPIMAISAQSNNDVLKSLLNFNIIAFIDKPFKFEEVTEMITKVFGTLNDESVNDNMIKISVIDTGLGISEDEITKVFERFHQVDNSETREQGGSGLGLAICKDIVEHHNGRIWVESEVGKGSSFNFSLPLVDIDKVSDKVH